MTNWAFNSMIIKTNLTTLWHQKWLSVLPLNSFNSFISKNNIFHFVSKCLKSSLGIYCTSKLPHSNSLWNGFSVDFGKIFSGWTVFWNPDVCQQL